MYFEGNISDHESRPAAKFAEIKLGYFLSFKKLKEKDDLHEQIQLKDAWPQHLFLIGVFIFLWSNHNLITKGGKFSELEIPTSS